MTATRSAHPALQRLRVELVSRDLLFVIALVFTLAVIQAVGEVIYPKSNLAGVTNESVRVLVPLWPIIGALPAALVAARDEESGVREVLAANSGPVDVMREAGVVAGMTMSLVLIAVVAVVGATVGAGRGIALDGLAVGLAVRASVALILTTPLLATFGMAVGRLTRSRAAAVGVLAGAALLAVIVDQLAIVIPSARWVALASPAGLLQFLIEGLGTTDLPGRASALEIVAWLAVATVVPILIVRWVDRQPAPRRPLSPIPRSARWAAAAAGSVAFGFVGPTLAVDALPWQYSPTWVLDQAAGNTPDRMVGEFLGRAVDGRMAEADALTVEHDAARTLGPLNEVLGALRGARTEVVRHAAVAGTVAVGWHDAAGQGYEVRACAVRTPNAWRLAYFTSRSSCGTR